MCSERRVEGFLNAVLQRGMKVIFANHALSQRTGSELGTIELARATAALGHQTAIFAMEIGPLGRAVRRQGTIPVLAPSDADEIRAFAPDVVHSHHVTASLYLRELLAYPVRVHEILGVLPALEAPPTSPDGFDLAVVLSEEIEAAVRAMPFGRAVPVRLLRNWFDDLALEAVKSRPMPRTPHVLVVSNYVAPRLRQSLATLQRKGEIALTFIGGMRQQTVTPSLLAGYDVVVAVGRTALLAGAYGIPCILADRDLSDGLLTETNVTVLRRANFSGRTLRVDPTVDHLRAQFAAARSLDTEPLQRTIRAEYGLKARVEGLATAYSELLAASRVPRPFAPAEGHAFAELVGRSTSRRGD
jgi:hypothetical protein